MAVTVISNTDTELSGKYVGEARVKTVTFSRTNAQVLALPSGASEILAAVANRLYVPIWAVIISDFSAGAYTNVHAGGIVSSFPYLTVANDAENSSLLDPIINMTADGYTDFTDFFGASDLMITLARASKLSGVSGKVISNVQTLANAVGNLVLIVNNAGDGNFTGGNAANTLTGTVGYLEVVV